jgi:hypothetical protein
LLTLFPYATYALPALASLFLFPVVIECSKRYALAVYAATALLALLITPDMEAKLLYVAFFGYYPVLKCVAESRRSRGVEWLIKLAVFNAAVVVAYAVLIRLGLSLDEFSLPGVTLPPEAFLGIFLLAGNGVFVLYDIGLTRVLPVYFRRFQPQLRRLLK